MGNEECYKKGYYENYHNYGCPFHWDYCNFPNAILLQEKVQIISMLQN